MSNIVKFYRKLDDASSNKRKKIGVTEENKRDYGINDPIPEQLKLPQIYDEQSDSRFL